jgi:integrase
MAQSARDARLETRTARLRLPIQQRHFKAIGDGLTLVYRRTGDGFGTWSTKLALPSGKYALRVLGTADDYQDANGLDVLSFRQAQEKARSLAEVAKANAGIVVTPLSVGEAAERYLAWFRDHRRAYRETEHAIWAHILPALGATRLDELTSAQIRGWLERLAAKPARVRTSAFVTAPKYRAAPKTADEKRARRATANRVFNVLKAILNRAFENGLVGDDLAWRKVKPFPKADEARIRFLSDAEAIRLVNACRPDLRLLVQAALLTGARNGELVTMTSRDVNPATAQIYVAHAKSGRPRLIPLNPEGVALFNSLVTGKTGDELLFGKNHHVRGVIEACRTARVEPAISFHELRHTYASHLAQAGVDLLTISKLLGHADTRVTSRHYAHLADKTLADAVTKLPSFGGQEREKVASIR